MGVIARIDGKRFVWIIYRCQCYLILASDLSSVWVMSLFFKKMRRSGLSCIFNHASCNILLCLDAALNLWICDPAEHHVRVNSWRINWCSCRHRYRFLHIFIIFLRYLKRLMLRSEMIWNYLLLGFKLILHYMSVKWFVFQVRAIFIVHILSIENFLVISQKCGWGICISKRLFLRHIWSLF